MYRFPQAARSRTESPAIESRAARGGRNNPGHAVHDLRPTSERRRVMERRRRRRGGSSFDAARRPAYRAGFAGIVAASDVSRTNKPVRQRGSRCAARSAVENRPTTSAASSADVTVTRGVQQHPLLLVTVSGVSE